MTGQAKRSSQFLKDEQRVGWHDESLWLVRKKRDKVANSVPEWEQLREQASAVKNDVLSNLDSYLLQFEEQATKNGAHVHWASDARRFNEIVLDIIKQNGAGRIVKSKSMLTEECGLNPYLEQNGIEIIDTDLGERIIQFRHEPPSHIVLPAIHLRKEEIGELFEEKLHTEKGNSDPLYLTRAARRHLREKFFQAEIALTGVNFAVAETGAVVVCTNEGNADLGVHSATVQIHCMGIEKIVPGMEAMGVFTRLLARSATGQPITTYTSHYFAPSPGGQMHIVLVDNGRSERLRLPDFKDSLKCIRCGACLNTCPVFRRSGGHSYGTTIPGPIGSVLAPHINLQKYYDLPFASSLCGSCTDVCPVKIDLHSQLYRWRQEISEQKLPSFTKRMIMNVGAKILSSSQMYVSAGKMARWGLKYLPRWVVYHKMNIWGRERELPSVPGESFGQWYLRTQILNRK